MTTKLQAQDKFIVVNGVRFHYREWGSAEAPPLLILHGLTGHAWEFDGVASALANQFHVLVVNQRGHGASAWAETYSPEFMAADIAAFIDALTLRHVHVIGHSMGGVNSWWFAAGHPERVERLVIIDVTPDTITSDELVGGMSAALDIYSAAQYTDPEDAVTEYLVGYTGAHRQALRSFVLNNLAQDAAGHWTWRFDARGLMNWIEYASASKEAHWSTLRHLACPTLVIRAGDSPFTDALATRRMVREIPQGRLVEIAGAGHDVHIDQYDVLLAELQPFLTAQ